MPTKIILRSLSTASHSPEIPVDVSLVGSVGEAVDAGGGVALVGNGMCALPSRGFVAVPYNIRAQSNSTPL